MTISIVKSQAKIETLIAGISTKSGAYKEAVSSAVLSAVAHSIEHGEYTLITKAITAVLEVNPRDVKVVGEFLKGVTPFTVEEKKVGRKVSYEVTGRLAKAFEPRKEGESEKDFGARKDAAKTRDDNRVTLFADFAGGRGIPVKNLAFVSKAETPNESKTVKVEYKLNIFEWFDDVEYARKKASDNGTTETPDNAVKAFDGVLAKLSNLLKDANATKFGLTVEDKQALQAAYDVINTRLEAIKPKVEADSDVETLKAAGADDETVAKWLAQRAKRLEEGKTSENIAAELTQFVESIKKAA